MAEYECYLAKLVVPGSEQEVIDIVRLTCRARLPVATRDSRFELAPCHVTPSPYRPMQVAGRTSRGALPTLGESSNAW
jgi:hypothetical protein